MATASASLHTTPTSAFTSTTTTTTSPSNTTTMVTTMSSGQVHSNHHLSTTSTSASSSSPTSTNNIVVSTPSPLTSVVLVAKFDYTAKDAHELDLRKGERLYLIDNSKQWWLVRRIDSHNTSNGNEQTG